MGVIIDMVNFFKKISSLFSRYPSDSLIRPNVLNFQDSLNKKNHTLSKNIICIQGVQDRFYFLFFGKIAEQLKLKSSIEIHLLASRSINGAVGSDLIASIKRWSIFSWLFSRQWERAYGTLINDIAYRSAPIFKPVIFLKSWIKSRLLWNMLIKQQKDFSLIVDGVDYADLVIDTYLRFKPAPSFDVSSSFVRYVICQLLQDILQAEEYFSSVKPRYFLSSYSTYTVHGVPARVAMKHGVKVLTFGDFSGFYKELTQDDPYHSKNCSNYRSEFDQLKQQEEKLGQSELMLGQRLKGHIDLAISYMRESAYSRKLHEMNTHDFDGGVVIFLHDFYDSPHIFPGLVFSDFWDWVLTTIKALEQSKIKFYLKPHPNQIEINKDVIDKLKKQFPNLNWLDSKVNNVELVKNGLVCGLTVYGTIAHELAFMGVPSITCAQHPHHKFDFCRTAHTREEYIAMLQSPEKLPIDKHEMKKQALTFYYMHNIHGESEKKKLVQSWVNLFNLCNYSDCSNEEILNQLNNLVSQRGFRSFINQFELP